MNFANKLEKAQEKNNSLLCVGLDTDPRLVPSGHTQYEFNKKIIDVTFDLVSAFKIQFAYYSAEGIEGIENLKSTIQYIKKNYSHIPVILDAKRGDIDSTSQKYTEEAFDFLDADALTVNPYLGFDSLKPFFERKDRGIIVVVRSSNRSAGDFQDLVTRNDPLYIHVAKKTIEWNREYGNLQMVVGSTWPEELEKLRKLTKEMIFLVPGVGSQGGDLKKTLKYGLRKDKKGLIIAASRSIIYAQNPRVAAKKLKDEINEFRNF